MKLIFNETNGTVLLVGSRYSSVLKLYSGILRIAKFACAEAAKLGLGVPGV
jgi:hypothetical protein